MSEFGMEPVQAHEHEPGTYRLLWTTATGDVQLLSGAGEMKFFGDGQEAAQMV